MGKLHQNLPIGGRKELNGNNMTPTSQICMAMIFMSCFMKYVKGAKKTEDSGLSRYGTMSTGKSYQHFRESC
jgi:hypothetical protein